MSGQFASIKEVAALAGVSPTTASRVLRGSGYSSSEARARVEEAAAKLQYIPHLAASGLRSRSSQMLGVQIQDIGNPFFAALARGIGDTSRLSEYFPFLSDSQEDPDREAFNLNLMLTARVAGVIVAPTMGNGPLLKRFGRLGVPIIQVDREVPGIESDSVLIDNVDAGRMGTEHLIQLGHRAIGVLAGPSSLTTGHLRLLGVRDVMREHGLELPDRHVKVSDFRSASADLLAEQILDERPMPTAVVAHNAILTERLFVAARRRGLSIPGDIAIVGFDDTALATLTSPTLTVVRQPVEDMGKQAAAMLIRRIEGEAEGDPPLRVQLGASLVVRGSSGATPEG